MLADVISNVKNDKIVRSNIDMRDTIWGYEISTVNPYAPKFHMYVYKVYNGQVEWVTDYTHAKHYTKRYAEALVKKIKGGSVRV